MSGKRVKGLKRLIRRESNGIILEHIREIKKLPFRIRIKIAWGILKGGEIK